MNNKLRVEIDVLSGFCFGVVNAISKAEESLADCGEVFSLGDIVHNRPEVQRLADLGLRTIGHDDLDSLNGKTLLIRAHGEPPLTYTKAKRLGMRIIDATCPVVARLQKIVADAWAGMREQNGQVVILGKRGHAEVIGLAGQAEGNVTVVESVSDLDAVDPARPVFLLSQTTQSLELFRRVADAILERTANPSQVTVKDTICRRVSSREPHLREFAARFDVVIFVAGHKSSNGRILFDVCRLANPRSYHIESPAELNPEWFVGAGTVGVCGATSTPQWLMRQVADEIAVC